SVDGALHHYHAHCFPTRRSSDLDITLTGGKMPNPLVTTLMTWDADINPEGAAEQWKHSFTFNFGGGGVEQAQQSYAKDSKNLARSEEHTSELQSLRHLVCRLLLE